jgi:hypothetical protein
MIKKLNTMGFSAEYSYAAGFLSVAASIAIWNAKRGVSASHAERFGIFVGLWAPTFFAIGNGLQMIADRKEADARAVVDSRKP